jgi:hypothetical protein
MPLLKRAAGLLLAPRTPSFTIWQGMLDEPVDALSERIRRYVETHAPEGWFGDDDGEEEDSAAEPKP